MDGTHEQLSAGVGAAIGADDTDSAEDSPNTVRIVPIPEGEVTVGQSGEPTEWGKEALRAAVEDGILDGATIVKGEGGENPHFPMDEQVPPENILGKVETWEYEDGVGPVGRTDIVDDQMAERIDAGLLDVSPDLYRRLGDAEGDDPAPVEEIVGMPRITVLEQGASEGASIESAMAEALAYNPDADTNANANANANADADTDPGGGGAGPGNAPPDPEQLSPMYAIQFHGYGDFVGDEFIDEAVTNLNEIQGVTGVRSDSTEDPEIVAVLDRDQIQMDGLNEQIITALEDTPFEVYEGFDWIQRVNTEQLAPGAAGAGAERDAEAVTDPADDEAAESVSDTTNSDMSDDDEPTKEELREQLAAAKAEKEQAEEDLDETTEDLDALEDEKEDLEAALEEREERIEALKADTEHARRRLALEATGGNESAADMLVDSEKPMDELAQSAAEANEDVEIDEDADTSPVAQVEEQLAATTASRGDSADEDADGTPDASGGGSGGQPDEEQLAKANEWAYEALSGSDITRVSSEEQLSPRDLAHDKTGVDPVECDSRAEFARKAANTEQEADD